MTKLKSNSILSKYVDELNEDVTLTVSNLREKALLCSSYRAKWLAYYYKEKENLQQIRDTKQQLIKQKSANNTVDSVLKMKREEALIKGDERIVKLNRLMEITQQNIDFIERALDVLSNFSFNIKNVYEIVKMENS